MEKKLLLRLSLLVFFAAFMTLPGCKDYEDDINSLQAELDSLKANIKTIQDKVDKGSIITSVENVDNGIVINFSDGKSYTLTNGSVVSIGENGHWFINNEDTGKPSQGLDGVYFIPGEDGFWHKVEGDKVTPTEDLWLIDGVVTAKWEDGSVVLYNVEGADGPITIGLVSMNNLIFVADYVADAYGIKPLLNFGTKVKDNGVEMLKATARYQVSPTNASAKLIRKDKLYFKFNNPQVVPTRASASDFKAEFVSLSEGVLTVNVTVAKATFEALKAEEDHAAQLMLVVPLTTGDEVVSDWVTMISVIEKGDYIMPYIRFFDGKEPIIAFEEARGHVLVSEDDNLDYLAFKTNSKVMPYVAYIVGRSAQVYSSAEVMKSDEFIEYMKEQGFETDGVIQSYGMMLFTTTKYKTVSAASIINAEGYEPGMTFSMIEPVLKKLDQPLLDFNATEADIAAYEEARGYPQRNVRTNGEYKEIHYGTLKEEFEYDELNLIKYLFKGSKLIKVTHLITPANYVITPLGDEAFTTRPPFTALVTSMGYDMVRKTTDTGAYELYSKEGQHKFTFEQWKLKLKGKRLPAAGIAYVPFDGPDKIESPEF